MGDFNVDVISDTVEKHNLLNLFYMYGLRPLFREPTRVTSHSMTCIDNVFTNSPDNCEVYTKNLHLADHHGQIVSRHLKTKHPENKQEVKYRLVNENTTYMFLEYISNICWDDLYTMADPEACYNLIHDRVFGAFDKLCPEKIKKVNTNREKSNKWYDQELGNMKTHLDALYVIASSIGDESSWGAYTTYKKQYKFTMKQKRKTLIEHRIENSDNRQQTVWRVIKEELGGKRNSKVSTLRPDDLNNFFIDTATRISKNMTTVGSSPGQYLKEMKSPTESFFMLPVTRSEVIKATRRLKTKDTQDIYGFSTKLLQRMVLHVLDPLTHVIDTCFRNGHFPERLKVASITPVLKKGDPNEESNYRPISILPVFSKVFEQIIKTRLVHFLTARDSITKNQHGFQAGKSTTTALVQLVEQVLDAFNGGESAQLTMLDLSRAFDLVDHEILLAKLQHYGVRGVSNRLLRSYLTGRNQRVKWNGEMSKSQINSMGVPQGSILGPFCLSFS